VLFIVQHPPKWRLPEPPVRHGIAAANVTCQFPDTLKSKFPRSRAVADWHPISPVARPLRLIGQCRPTSEWLRLLIRAFPHPNRLLSGPLPLALGQWQLRAHQALAHEKQDEAVVQFLAVSKHPHPPMVRTAVLRRPCSAGEGSVPRRRHGISRLGVRPPGRTARSHRSLRASVSPVVRRKEA
jgi:hypothetical protein